MSDTSGNWASDPTLPGAANITADHDGWHTLERTLEYDGPFAKVYHELVVTPTRPEGISWTVVRRKNAVVVAAKTVDDRWLLIRQERIAIRQAIWEFPAGQIEMEAGDFTGLQQQSVWRELREETGYAAGPDTTLTPLGVFFPSAGFTDEHSYLFLADQLVPHADGAQHDEAESIVECRSFTPDEFRQMIASAEIRDANTLAAFARLVTMGLI
ncbi:MAG: NUDIX hydrolase [Chthoniobacterales bacterium]